MPEPEALIVTRVHQAVQAALSAGRYATTLVTPEAVGIDHRRGFRLIPPPLAGLGLGFEILAGGDSRAVVLGRCPCPPHDGLREQLQEFLLVERLRTL
ncbi:hypothetical protein [Calidithermus terrae]|uniref:hypothetical protein n=1 Tax=Calidithermus terrae TaxID=1408545 RepID=UPI0011C457B5|nr:hypothetical protein [Calidithermus terrae]